MICDDQTAFPGHLIQSAQMLNEFTQESINNV